MKVTIFGAGYVGLVTGACLAETGILVNCIDVDEERIKKLQKGDPVIYEPGLKELLEKNIKAGKIGFSSGPGDFFKESRVVMIAVGTPSGEDGSANLKYVFEAAKSIGQNLEKYALVVQKSTVPVGTCREIRQIIQKELSKRGSKIDFSVASNPEFLKEGDAVEDFLKPSRIILGVDNGQARKILERLYAPFMRKRHKIIFMNIESAELTKYAANCMLATRISFMNILARLSEQVGADIEEIRAGIGSDPRIGEGFLYAGVGYGGSCFPKDVKALIKTLQEKEVEGDLIQAVDKINKRQRDWFLAKIISEMKDDLKGKTIAIWGLSFKAGTDDIREAPSLDVGVGLIEKGAMLKVYDPEAMESFKSVLKHKAGSFDKKVAYYSDEYSALSGADALVILNEWFPFRNPDYGKMKEVMRQPIIFDGRNLLNPQEAQEEGFEYFGVGRITN